MMTTTTTTKTFEITRVSTGDLGGEPLHDQNRSLDQGQSELDRHRDAEAAGADAGQGQPAGPPKEK